MFFKYERTHAGEVCARVVCKYKKKKGDTSIIVFGWWKKDKIISADDHREQAQEEVNPCETA